MRKKCPAYAECMQCPSADSSMCAGSRHGMAECEVPARSPREVTMQSRNGRTIGIAWYKRKDYRAIRAIMDDAHRLPVDYDTWLRQAESVVRLELALGSDIVKVTIDPGVFVAWCESTG